MIEVGHLECRIYGQQRPWRNQKIEKGLTKTQYMSWKVLMGGKRY